MTKMSMVIRLPGLKAVMIALILSIMTMMPSAGFAAEENSLPADMTGEDVTVNVDVGNHGSVNEHSDDFKEVVPSDVPYEINLKSDEGYVIHSVLINDEPAGESEDEKIIGEESATIKLDEIGSDVDITAVFSTSNKDEESGDDGDDEKIEEKETIVETSPESAKNDDATTDTNGGNNTITEKIDKSSEDKTEAESDSQKDGEENSIVNEGMEVASTEQKTNEGNKPVQTDSLDDKNETETETKTETDAAAGAGVEVGVPKTGDNINLMIPFASVALACLIALAVFVIRRRSCQER